MKRKWVEIPAPKYLPEAEYEIKEIWMKDMDRAWTSSDGIVVYSRLLYVGKFLIEHAVIMKDDRQTPILWFEKQKIKNELFGEIYEAVEIYPEECYRQCSEGVYHLWLFPKNVIIPFGLNKRMKVVSRNLKRDPIGFVAELARIMGIK